MDTEDEEFVHRRIFLCSCQGVIRTTVNTIETLAPLSMMSSMSRMGRVKGLTKPGYKNRLSGYNKQRFSLYARMILEPPPVINGKAR